MEGDQIFFIKIMFFIKNLSSSIYLCLYFSLSLYLYLCLYHLFVYMEKQRQREIEKKRETQTDRCIYQILILQETSQGSLL